MEKIKVVAYMRFGKAEDANTIDYEKINREVYAELCEKRGMELVDTYCDYGYSTKKKRLGFIKMMEDSKTGKFQRVIVKSTTKLNDNIKEFIQTVQELKKNGVSVWLAKYDCLAEELLEELKPLIEKITKKQ